MSDLAMHVASVGAFSLPVLAFPRGRQLSWPVSALIGNSITTSDSGRRRTRDWKIAVARGGQHARGAAPWDERSRFAVTLGFAFHPPSHGNRAFDVENFTKPTLDAVAAALFSPNGTDVAALARWNFDDSGFHHLLVHRLADADRESSEGAAVFVSASD